MPVFEQYARGQQLGMQQGRNALAMNQFIEKQRRDQELRNVLAQAYTPALEAAPAQGPLQPGAAPMPDYPAQAGGFDRAQAANALMGKGFLSEGAALMPTEQEGFTLGAGQKRYDASGKLIAEGGPATSKTGWKIEETTLSDGRKQKILWNPADPTQRKPFGQPYGGMEPVDKNAPWAKIQDPKKRDDAKIRFGAKAQASVEKARKDAYDADKMDQDLDRFLFLNEQNTTGGAYALPGLKATRAFDAGFQEMKGISDRLTPGMRQGLPGAASERDTAMFRGGTVSVEKSDVANKNIALGLKALNANKRARAKFLDEFVAANGHDRGAEKQFREYLEANPIFDPMAKIGSYTLNKNRKSVDEWMATKSAAPTKTYEVGEITQSPSGQKVLIRTLKADGTPDQVEIIP